MTTKTTTTKSASKTAALPPTSACPCGSGSELGACCLPLIQGKKQAATAQELLRARYTAFVVQDVDFVLKTHHSKTRSEVKREEIEDWSANSEWLGLKIAQQEAGTEKDDRGTIVFCAEYKPVAKNDEESKKQEHWEQSFFERENGEWRFLDAKGVHIGTYRRQEPKIGRNDPCPCGSGKKSKKCCAA